MAADIQDKGGNSNFTWRRFSRSFPWHFLYNAVDRNSSFQSDHSCMATLARVNEKRAATHITTVASQEGSWAARPELIEEWRWSRSRRMWKGRHLGNTQERDCQDTVALSEGFQEHVSEGSRQRRQWSLFCAASCELSRSTKHVRTIMKSTMATAKPFRASAAVPYHGKTQLDDKDGYFQTGEVASQRLSRQHLRLDLESISRTNSVRIIRCKVLPYLYWSDLESALAFVASAGAANAIADNLSHDL